MIRTKRVYDPPEPSDGKRILVDRLWPRGIRREQAGLDMWAKEAAPSDGLRKWFGHDPGRWDEFVRRYHEELDGRPAAWQPILEAARTGGATLLFAARDPQRNNAVALRTFLEGERKRGRGKGSRRA